MSTTDSPQEAVAPAAVPPAGPAPATGESARTVVLPGFSLVVRRHEDRGGPAGREPAFFVHGLGGSSQNWSLLMGRLADRVAGEALDLPGFGHSPPPDDGDYSIAGHARAVIRLLDHEPRGPVHLFGNSMGGAVAVKVAAARPDLVRTLTLVSPALPEVPPQRTAWPTALASVPGLPALYVRATRRWTVERRTEALLALCYGDPSTVPGPVREEAAREYRRRVELPYFWDAMIRSTRGLVNAYTLGGQHALWRQAERVLAPTLLVYGGRDKLVSPRMAPRAARAFRDARLLLIPESGHVAMMEHPELVSRAFRDLLDEVDAAGAADADRTPPADTEAPAPAADRRLTEGAVDRTLPGAAGGPANSPTTDATGS
ncbi:alpha/beta fold hydrolase [Actinacidiphila sp. ITFR-21]|uniref:alpha/beta fold hydrolase n=1 Tax=Actinacidiphila sp. ITFR-21 TaxID=3075199 RepID=UPI00288A2908|nr:alpha/beta hydrolase [Streptomyces sp. ITFR-21]WNI17872.1 alpha/beta hydrolase [Streptomyces sp. ITFR-21]